MTMTDSTMTVRFAAGANLRYTVAAPCTSLSPFLSSSTHLLKISKGFNCQFLSKSINSNFRFFPSVSRSFSGTKQRSLQSFNQKKKKPLVLTVDCRCIRSSAAFDVTSGRLSSPGGCDAVWHKCGGSRNPSSVLRRRSLVKSRVGGSVEPLGSASDPKQQNGRSRYHASEDIGESESISRSCEDRRLSAPEMARTIVEVNTKASILFPGLSDEELEKHVLWPELPYVTDEHGNIYFQVRNDEDFLQNLTSETRTVEVTIGPNTTDMVNDLDLFSSSDISFGIDEIEDEESDDEDEYEDNEDEYENDEDNEEEEEEDDEDWDSVLEEMENDSDDSPGDWAKLETMRYSHPLYFAESLTEAAEEHPIDMMEQPAAGLLIKGLLRPALIDEHFNIKRRIGGLQANNVETSDIEKFVKDNLKDNEHGGTPGLSTIWPDETGNYQAPASGTSFYKLEMVRIHLLLANGHRANVEVEDFTKAQPDTLVHSSAKIISRVNACKEKMAEALKSLCWRCKGIQVEEATLVGIDALGFDVRVCSGTQIQTLRFSFCARATSESNAESQLNDLLFPRSNDEPQMQEQTRQSEC